MSVNLPAFQGFLKSQTAAFESFLHVCKDISPYELHAELAKHTNEMGVALTSAYPRSSSTLPSILKTPGTARRTSSTRNVSLSGSPLPKRSIPVQAIPTRTPSRRVRPDGASTVFRNSPTKGSAQKRPRFSDSSDEAREDLLMSPGTPLRRSATKRHVVSSAYTRRHAVVDSDIEIEQSWRDKEVAEKIEQEKAQANSAINSAGRQTRK